MSEPQFVELGDVVHPGACDEHAQLEPRNLVITVNVPNQRAATYFHTVKRAILRNDRIRRLELLRFQELPDYRPPAAWLQLFQGRELDSQLSLKGSVVKLTGATLTADAVTDAARRMLALHQIVRPFREPAR